MWNPFFKNGDRAFFEFWPRKQTKSRVIKKLKVLDLCLDIGSSMKKFCVSVPFNFANLRVAHIDKKKKATD